MFMYINHGPLPLSFKHYETNARMCGASGGASNHAYNLRVNIESSREVFQEYRGCALDSAPFLHEACLICLKD